MRHPWLVLHAMYMSILTTMTNCQSHWRSESHTRPYTLNGVELVTIYIASGIVGTRIVIAVMNDRVLKNDIVSMYILQG